MQYAKRSDDLKGIASIGTPFRLNNKTWINLGQIFLPIMNPFWRRLQKIKRLRLSPIGATNIVMEYLQKDFLIDINLIKTPVIFLHSKKDPVSDYKVLPGYLGLISSAKKEIKFFENGNHVIDHDCDLVISYILDFFGLK